MGKIIVISSGKGGVGKTTTTLNLAYSLSKLKKKVLLVDANLSTPNIGLHLGLTKFPITFNDLLEDVSNIDDGIYAHPYGFHLMPSSIKIKDENYFLNRYRLKEIFSKVKKKYDYILVDSAAGTGFESSEIIKIADELLIITNPELPSISDAFKIVSIAKKNKIPIKGVILNRISKNEEFDIGSEAIKSLLELPIKGKIFEDKHMRESMYKKKPISHHKPYNKSSKQYLEIAKILHDEDFGTNLASIKEQNNIIINLLNKLLKN